MKTKSTSILRTFLAPALSALFATGASAANRYAVSSGNWDDAVWGSSATAVPGSPAPVNGDGAFIIPGVSVHTNNTTATLIVLRLGAASGSALSELTIGGGGDVSTLTLSRAGGEMDVSLGRTASTNSTLNINTGGNLDASTNAAAASSSLFAVGYAGSTTARVNINGGTLSANTLVLGNGSSSKGYVTVNGGSLTTNALTLGLGSTSEAELTVQNGGQVTVNDVLAIGWGTDGTANFTLTDGTVTLAKNFYVARAPNASANLTVSGGVFDQETSGSGTSYVASGTGSTATVTVNGTGTLRAKALYIGFRGNGTVNVTDGLLSLSAGSGAPTTVGDISGSNGTLRVSGGCFTQTSASAVLAIGNQTGSTGRVEISGSGQANVANIIVGLGGSGTLEVSGGALNARDITFASDSGSTGTVTLNGGSLSATGNLIAGSGTATLALNGGSLSANALLFIIADASFASNFDITGSVANLSLANGIIVDLSSYSGDPTGETFNLLTYADNALEGANITFLFAPEASLQGTATWAANTLAVTIAAIPEPATCATLLGLSVLAVFALRRRR
ncbi:MAG: carbohydrate-binding domain-containing protein [Opitutaceae bacterium]|jgi:T5SS/PEP-CTERM-associated repeat protein|nr:carbohydrate-binding domain-containing protein [Opitutaceae bacterium]